MNKRIFILVFFTIIVSCKSQKATKLKGVENYVSKFLLKKGDLSKLNYEKAKKTGVGVSVYGLYNKVDSVNLKDGVYGFSKGMSHSRVYFLIYRNKEVKILDTSSQKALTNSIKEFLDFAEEKGYCVNIINDYIRRFINSYFIINKHPNIREDNNCYKDVISTQELP